MPDNSLYHPVSIGSLTIEGNLFLAPLAGYTDRSFRSICLAKGANLAYTEMVSAEGLARDNAATQKLMQRADNEKLLAVQIFGPDSEVIKRSLSLLLEHKPNLIDLNCGCPVPKVVKDGSGSALMKNPDKIYAIVKELKDSTSIPISVKIRLGWDHSSINYKEVTSALLEANVDMITMHARTRSMGYGGKADWQSLAFLKEYIKNRAPKVPLFGSGDLFSPNDAKRMLEETKVDGIMFARGALGNPFIFEQTHHLLTTGELLELPSLANKLETMLNHLHKMAFDLGEEQAARQMRKHAVDYLKGVAYASKAKQAFVTAQTVKEYEEICATLSQS